MPETDKISEKAVHQMPKLISPEMLCKEKKRDNL